MKPQSKNNSFQVPPVLLFGVAYLMALVVSVFICISIYTHYSNSDSSLANTSSANKNSEVTNAAVIISQP